MTKIEIPDKIEFVKALDAVRALIRETLQDSEAPMDEIVRYLAESEGKNFRASLLLAASAGDGGDVPKNAVITAAALELLHLASLVHDDVIDDAETRRGRQSVRQLFGNKPAVICGDYLFCKCFLLVAGISGPYQDKFADIAQAMTKICLGELREFRRKGDFSLGVKDKIIAGKTSALFALALYAGTILGGYGEAEARHLAHFGHNLGMCFQLTDDCIDYQTDAAVAGKNVRHDLKEGVVTLPLIFAMAKAPALRDAVGAGLDVAGIASIVSEVVALGGVHMTMDVAAKYCRKASKLLETVPVSFRRTQLEALLEQIRTRVY
jgi:heptaprenyl diphosphate synthase